MIKEAIAKMTLISFAIVLCFIVVVSAKEELDSICFPFADCKKKEEMHSWFHPYFENEPHAPCLNKSIRQFVDDTYLYCFTSEYGHWRTCRCSDDVTSFDPIQCNPDLYLKHNTMCIYPNSTFGPDCGEVIASPVIWNSTNGFIDQNMKDAIVASHNSWRSTVANGKARKGVNGTHPQASNMMELKWNDELAEVAQRWANQCVDGHDSERSIGDFVHVGQNVGQIKHHKSKSIVSVTENVIERFYAEVRDVYPSFPKDFKSFVKYGNWFGLDFPTGIIGHFTQLVWHSTYNVGCGFVQTKDPKDPDWRISALVCNYGPGGNNSGEDVYKMGSPGSECPYGSTKTSQGLCKHGPKYFSGNFR